MRRALCIGIDEYKGAALQGCVNDAKRVAEVLRKNYDGAPNFDVRTLVAPIGSSLATATRQSVRQAIDLLFRDKADLALLHFSGHGTVNNLGGYLVTQDATQYDDGVPMADVLKLANDSPVSAVVIILDCCYSGNLGNPPAVDNSRALLREGVSILTASRGDQPSLEAGGGGVFTSLVVDALEGGAADVLGNVSVPSIYAYVEASLGAWDQRPLLKAHVAQLVPLRCCAPPIERSLLRKLPVHFPLPAEDLKLDPSYEPTSAAADHHNVSVFAELQALSRLHLVAPVGTSHMYEAAMQSRACRLTHSGRYYWRLAHDGRI